MPDRNSPEVQREENKRLLNDPAFVKLVADEEQFLCAKIQSHVPDGTEVSQQRLNEYCYELQAWNRIKRRLWSTGAELNERQGEANSG